MALQISFELKALIASWVRALKGIGHCASRARLIHPCLLCTPQKWRETAGWYCLVELKMLAVGQIPNLPLLNVCKSRTYTLTLPMVFTRTSFRSVWSLCPYYIDNEFLWSPRINEHHNTWLAPTWLKFSIESISRSIKSYLDTYSILS